MFAQDQLERAVHDMRAQFLTVSGQIADELTRLAQHVAASPASVRERVITAAAQIASTQQFLRAESDRLPSDPQERYAIMESVLQAQQGALHQLAIIVKQHAPGWYPILSNTAAWYPSLPNAAAWSQNSAAAPAVDASVPNTAIFYPSPPTAQDLATHGWPQAHGNGYAADMQGASAQHVWPTGGTAGAVIPYGSGVPSDASGHHGPWPGRRGYALVPAQQASREMRPARGYGSNGGQMLATARRQAELVGHGVGSRNLFWIGLVVCALIFAYLSFPWEIRRLEAVANQPRVPAREADEQRSVPPVAFVPRPRVTESAPQTPTLIARAEEEPPPPPAPAPVASGMILPGGMMTGTPGVAIGALWPGQANAPPAGRAPPPVEVAAVPAESTSALAARTKQRAPSRAEPETAATTEAAPRTERFVPVLFTHQDEPTAAQAFADLQLQYPNLLANRQGETQPVDLGKKGVWHRLVVLPASSRQDASNLCGQLTGAGYERCWVKPY